MDISDISTDQVVLWKWRFIALNYTIIFTWLVMAFLFAVSWLTTRNITSDTKISHWQNLLEIIVIQIREQIRGITDQSPRQYLPFIGTLFIFIAISNLLSVVPGFYPPTASLSTTAALAICVFVAVPIYGISHKGFIGYLKIYTKPSILVLPFNIIGDLSRTLALAVRLFGNMMSGTKIVAILISIVPLFFPILMHALGLLIGLVQAYIFAVLAMVYIASATLVENGSRNSNNKINEGGKISWTR